jgi:hypothetical protein
MKYSIQARQIHAFIYYMVSECMLSLLGTGK